MKLVYPALFTPFEDGSGGYTVEFPDENKVLPKENDGYFSNTSGI